MQRSLSYIPGGQNLKPVETGASAPIPFTQELPQKPPQTHTDPTKPESPSTRIGGSAGLVLGVRVSAWAAFFPDLKLFKVPCIHACEGSSCSQI